MTEHRATTGESIVARPGADDRAWHTLAIDAAAAGLRTSATRGLSYAAASAKLHSDGRNALPAARTRSVLRILLAQFRSLLVVLLIAATALEVALGEYVEAVAVLVVIVLNATIGFFTEWWAQRSLVALAAQSIPTAHVVREGVEHQIAAEELVAGDLVMLGAGSRVPADGRISASESLAIEESALTGESEPVVKTVDALADGALVLAERRDMAFLGSIVTAGRGAMLVTTTGPRTEAGKIGALVDASQDAPTPLERKLSQLGRWLVLLVLVLSSVIVLVGWLRGHTFLHMLEIGISLAIAAVPEGLAAVATITLAIGMQRMARARALVRRLPAVETLGATTVICTDKTGTLTKNEMTVRVLVLASGRVDVTGSGYAPAGELRRDDVEVTDADTDVTLALRIGALCNDADVDATNGAHAPKVLGDPTEAALIVVGQKRGVSQAASERAYPRLAEVPFDTVEMRMVTVHRTPEGKTVAYVKGAPGAVLDVSEHELVAGHAVPLTDARKLAWRAQNDALAGSALRVLALAYEEMAEDYVLRDVGRALTFVGLVAMQDTLRPEATKAIATCHAAGIRTIMITGDQEVTAAEIARQLGLDHGPDGRAQKVVHGRSLDALDDDGWRDTVRNASVFARVSPEQKLRIVEALQHDGEIVAMTGDGTNDAPAIKRADIGIAMGIRGTDVAKSAADMVILDDDFSTIVGAVEQGRVIYANIVRFVHYLFSCNLAEILVVFLAIVFGWPLPLVAMQILWLNMVTDVFPALALALEPTAPGAMQQPPRDPREPVVPLRLALTIGWQGALLAAVTLAAFVIGRERYGDVDDSRAASTMVFTTLALAQVFHTFNARSQRRSIFGPGLFANGWLWGAVLVCVVLQLAAVYVPLLQRVLGTAPPAPFDWLVIIGCALTPVLVVELVKLTVRLSGGASPRASVPTQRAVDAPAHT